jgi:hypothetical protein
MNIQEAIEHMGPEPVCASDILRGMGRGTGTSARKRLTDRLEAAEAAGEHGIRSVEGRFGDRLWVLDPDRACQPYKPEPTVKGPSVLDARAQAVGAYDYCECGKMAYRTQQDAEDGMRRIALGGVNRNGKPIRVYQCRSGDWHITSKPYRPTQRPGSVR